MWDIDVAFDFSSFRIHFEKNGEARFDTERKIHSGLSFFMKSHSSWVASFSE